MNDNYPPKNKVDRKWSQMKKTSLEQTSCLVCIYQKFLVRIIIIRIINALISLLDNSGVVALEHELEFILP